MVKQLELHLHIAKHLYGELPKVDQKQANKQHYTKERAFIIVAKSIG